MGKKGHWFSFFCLLIFFPLWGNTQSLSWDYTDIETSVHESGANPDMVIDQAGGIHICYWERETDQLIYAYRATPSSGWAKENVAPNRPCGFKSAIALDNVGNPHIAFLENQNGNSQVRYASHTGSSWAVENIPGEFSRGHWGEYGPNAPNNFTERIKPGIDLVIKSSGEPHIIFFDAWMNDGAFPFCESFSNYGWQLHQAYKLNGNWKTKSTLGQVPDKHNSCAGDSLPRGDRYGEYASIIQRNDGSLLISAMSRWNNEVLLLDNFAGQDTLWLPRAADSLDRARTAYTWARQWFTMEGISLYESPDSTLHLAYTTSLLYGENFCCTTPDPAPWVTSMVYTTISDDTVIYKNFGDTPYRNYTSITGKGNDTLFVVWGDMKNGAVVVMDTITGDSATYDTVYHAAPISTSPAEVYGDTLHILVFDDVLQRLVLAKRHVDGGAWVYDNINLSEDPGASLDAAFQQQTGDTAVFMAYTDGFLGKLFYKEGSKNGAWSFATEEPDPGSDGYQAVSFRRGPAGEPCILYAGGQNRQLRLAVHNGTSWQVEVVDSNDFVTYTQLALDANDTLHIAWYDGNARCLNYGKRSFAGSTWSFDVIDCGYDPVGQWPSLKIGSDNLPRIAYYHEFDLSLKYATVDPQTRAWNIETAYTNPPSPVGKYASLELLSNDAPVIAFLDEQRTSVMLAERNLAGLWEITVLDSSSVFNIGRPIELEIDKFDNPWIAYNSFSNFDRIKLLHRDTIWRAVSVSSAGRIANSFRFHIENDDLYIVGKKNEPGNEGLGMLFAGNGLFIQTDDPLLTPGRLEVRNYPNPFEERTTLEISNDMPGNCRVAVLNSMGQHMQMLWTEKWLPAGTHRLNFNGASLPTGLYFLRITLGEEEVTHKIILRR